MKNSFALLLFFLFGMIILSFMFLLLFIQMQMIIEIHRKKYSDDKFNYMIGMRIYSFFCSYFKWHMKSNKQHRQQQLSDVRFNESE